MIEVLGFLSVLLIDSLMKDFPSYPAMVNSYVSMTLVFMAFANFIVLSLKDKVPSAVKRYTALCLTYALLIANGILAVFYFSYYVFSYPAAKIIIQIIVYMTYVTLLVFTKKFELKQAQNYGLAYKRLVIAYIAIVSALSVLDFFIDTKIMILHSIVISAIIVLLGLLALVSITIKSFIPYWYHKQILFMRLLKLANTYSIDKAVIPPQREIESDAILREVKYVLDRSFIRPVELNRLTKHLYRLMLKEGYDRQVAANYAGMWSETMICNLMRREYDFSLMPNFIIRKILKVKSHFSKLKNNRRPLV